MKRVFEQWPKNKEFSPDMLSAEQISWRIDAVKKALEPGSSKICKRCGKEQHINEFYFKAAYKGEKRRSNFCRDCTLFKKGIVEIGKKRFAKKVFEKGFRKCNICKDIKPLTEFWKDYNRNTSTYSYRCKCCDKLQHDKYKQ